MTRVQIKRIAGPSPAAYGLHLAWWDCHSLQQVVVERVVRGAMRDTTRARSLAEASLEPIAATIGRRRHRRDKRLSRNSRENRTSFEGRSNTSNGLARRESEL
jgi:hypothetical protein